jgi:GT2 family glycosyltransferase
MMASHQTSTSANPSVYAVVPAYNRCEKTLRFLRSFSKVLYTRRRAVIVDDGSTDGTSCSIELNYPDAIVLHGDGDLWWSGGTNMGVTRALEDGADYILTINDDAVMEPDFLTQMVAIARRNPKFIVGCRMQCQDRPGEIWSIGSELALRAGTLFRLNFAGQRWETIKDKLPNPYPVQTLAGNGVLIPRAVFEQVGLYDAGHMPQYHADSDLVMRAREHGFQPVVALDSVLYNHILEKPLVDNRIDLILSKKSDRYWRAIWATLRRHAPWGRRTYLMLRQYSPFFFNGLILRRCKRFLRRLLESRDPIEPPGTVRGYNPTAPSGPTGGERGGESRPKQQRVRQENEAPLGAQR